MAGIFADPKGRCVMAALKAEKPETVATVNRLPNIDQLGGKIDFENTAPHVVHQVARLAKQYGLSDCHAALVASLAFKEARL